MNDHSLTIVSIGGRFVKISKVLMENALNWPGFIINYRRIENVSMTGLKAAFDLPQPFLDQSKNARTCAVFLRVHGLTQDVKW